jgi:hypothetical protein
LLVAEQGGVYRQQRLGKRQARLHTARLHTPPLTLAYIHRLLPLPLAYIHRLLPLPTLVYRKLNSATAGEGNEQGGGI